MSIPQIRTEAIEAVGRKILMEYDPSLLSGQPCSVPIETIIETKFDLILEFHSPRVPAENSCLYAGREKKRN